MGLICTSCGKDVTNDQQATVFKCPACGKETIVRCGQCRAVGARYTCKSCGFTGP